jgi:hypothetical protein
MTTRCCIRFAALATLAAVAFFAQTTPVAAATSGQAQPSLRIVVIEGEDAVNVIQQKTATMPVVEVRDSNDIPVAGAIVRFAIRGSKPAAFGANQAAIVTTDAAGRATAPLLTPLKRGAVRIDVSAAFNGQSGSTSINQFNVATATSKPPDVRSGNGSGSATKVVLGTLAGIGAAAGAGAVVLDRVQGDGEVRYGFQADFSTDLRFGPPCNVAERNSWRLTLELTVQETGAIAGEAEVGSNGGTLGTMCAIAPHEYSWSFPLTRAPLSGSRDNLTFTMDVVARGTNNPRATVTQQFTFVGTLVNSAMTGTITRNVTVANPDVSTIAATASRDLTFSTFKP